MFHGQLIYSIATSIRIRQHQVFFAIVTKRQAQGALTQIETKRILIQNLPGLVLAHGYVRKRLSSEVIYVIRWNGSDTSKTHVTKRTCAQIWKVERLVHIKCAGRPRHQSIAWPLALIT
jgi:hypothetical protein